MQSGKRTLAIPLSLSFTMLIYVPYRSETLTEQNRGIPDGVRVCSMSVSEGPKREARDGETNLLFYSRIFSVKIYYLITYRCNDYLILSLQNKNKLSHQ